MSEVELRELLQVVEEDQSTRIEGQMERRRESLREVLFFLELVRPVRQSWLAAKLGVRRAVEDYCPFALRQVGILAAAEPEISSGDKYIGAMLEGARQELDDDRSESPTNPRARLMADAASVLRRMASVLNDWDSLQMSAALEEEEEARAALEGIGPDADAVALRDCMSRAVWLRDRVHEFLALTERAEPSPPRRFLRFRFPDLVRFLGKNLALIWVLPVVAFVALGVEAVNSLLRNDPGFTLLAVLLAALPFAATRGRILTMRWSVDGESGRVGAEVASWDLGGRAFRSLKWAAVGPPPVVRRWPRSRHLLHRLRQIAGSGAASAAETEESQGGEARRLAGAFLKLSAVGRPGILRAVHLTQLLRLVAYGAWWTMCGLLIYRLTDPAQPLLTSYVILVALAALLLVAHEVDLIDFLYPHRVRLRLLLAGLGVLLLVLLSKEELFPWFFLVFALYLLGRYARERSRFLELIVGAGCLLIAVLTGVKDQTNKGEVWREPGGAPLSRLTLLAGERAAECKQVPDWPSRPPATEDPAGAAAAAPVVLMAASGGGSRAAIYTGLTLHSLHQDLPEVAWRLQAISSVSGGSLANAAYTVRRLEAGDDGTLARRLDDMVEALRGDFLRPTLEGATLDIGTSRGRAIEKHWRSGAVGLDDWTIGGLAREWRKTAKTARGPSFPVPLFNTSTLDSHDVVISPLAKAYYTRSDLPTAVELPENATWVYDRDGIYGLEDLLATYDPLLAEAVRASANFPFGFPLVRISTTMPLSFSPVAQERQAGTAKMVYLTDGGALSNSGMWPLFNLLANRCLIDQLRQRGVLLVVVEASRMPEYPVAQKKYGTLWSAIGDQAPIAQSLHRRAFDYLEALYGDRLAVLQIGLVPDSRHNVLTTWALSNRSFETLKSSFASQWSGKRVQLCGKWQALTGSDPNGSCSEWRAAAVDAVLGELIDRQRPPLD